MTGYTRQSTFIPGDVIKAEHGNDEFNQLVAFAAQASGHKHDGTAAEGAYVPSISDTTFTDRVEIVAGGAKTTGTHQVTGLLSGDAAITAGTTIAAGTTITAGTGITATTGNVTVSSGNVAVTGNITVSGTVDGRDVLTDGTKLDTIETSATADQTAAEIRALVESATDSNVFTDADHTKLNAIEASATADQTAAEIRTLVEAATDSNVFTDADHTKLNGIATSANNYTHPSHPGDDFTVDTGLLSGASVVSDIDINVTTDALGHVTDANGVVATRTLTLANLGYTGATNANNYVHPTYLGDDFSVDTGALSGATVVSDIDINVTTDTSGHVVDANGTVATRTLTLANLGYTGETNATADQTKADIDALNINADTLDTLHASSFLRGDAASAKTSGTLSFLDNILLAFGSSNDALFYCDGAHMYTTLGDGIGNWYIKDGALTRYTFDDNGHFTASGDVTAFSDIRLKKNIEVIPNALDKVQAVSGYTFDRTDVELPRQTGVIAQEILEILPEAVHEDEDGNLSVAYGNMVGLLIEAVKELSAKVDELEAR